MDSHNFKVLIAGGGIAGLVLANILEQLGIGFLVLEAYPEISPQVGASIGLFPNGCRILDQIGCYDGVRAKLDECMSAIHLKSPEALDLGDAVEQAGEHFIARHGYEPVFIDRQTATQVFYDRLKDKSKVLVDQRVDSVTLVSNGVQVITKAGVTYIGDVLVGADGVHSAVRKEMWRLGDELSPGYFPKSDRTDVPCEYKCMYGISSLVPGLKKKSSSISVLGQNHSHLLFGGPGGRIYWFLFIKNEKTLHGMEKDIPRRYTKEEEKAVAEQYWNDPIEGDLKFGDLYRSNISAILTPLPEYVCKKWHFGRITTIGDAVHKFNPITGQGGNSAIETAATLATELFHMLKQTPEKASPSDADIAGAFQRTQDLRHERVSKMIEAGHLQQRLFAFETPLFKFVATHVLPLAGVEKTLEYFANSALPARRLPMLPMPKRPRFEPYQDELPAKPLGGKKLSRVSMGIAATIFASLLVVATQVMYTDAAFVVDATLLSSQNFDTGNFLLDKALTYLLTPLHISGEVSSLTHPLQSAYHLTLLFPIHLIWTIEGYRNANTSTIVSLPIIFTTATQLYGIGLTAPLYFLLSTWTTSRTPSTRAIGRPVPASAAHAVLPAAILGYGAPTMLLFPRTADGGGDGYAQGPRVVVVVWQLSAVIVALLTRLGAWAHEAWCPPTPFDMYKKPDLPALRRAYAAAFCLCALAHHRLAPAAAPALVSGSAAGLPRPWLAPMSGLLGGDFALGALAVMLWCLYSVWELRRNGWATTKEAVVAAVMVVFGQGLVGPGAVYAGLWWWREGVWAQEANLEGRE